MKKMKLAVVFAALVSVLGFSSCLNDGDSSPSANWTGYATVKESYMGTVSLVGDDGLQFTPVSSSVLAPLKLSDGTYYKRVIVAVRFTEDEVITEGKTNYKISELVNYTGVAYKNFTTRPDTLKNDYPLVSLDMGNNGKIWAKNGFVNLPFTYKVNSNLSSDDFHMYAVDAKEDTLYTRFRQTKSEESAYNIGKGVISFALPFDSEYYYMLNPKNDSIVIKVTAPGENDKALVTTVKYRASER